MHEQEKYLSFGFDAFLSKPFHTEQIYQCLASLLQLEYQYKAVDASHIPLVLSQLTLPEELRIRLKEAAERYSASNLEIAIDEVAQLSAEGHQLQVKLLRVLEDGCFTPVGGTDEKHVDVRILTATNANLQTKIANGTFREDLYFRLARFTVNVPPLRERKEDIPLLASHFLNRLSAEMGIEPPVLTLDALSALETYHFPGNVRELKNIIEHALILSRGADIQPEHLHFIDINHFYITAKTSSSRRIVQDGCIKIN